MLPVLRMRHVIQLARMKRGYAFRRGDILRSLHLFLGAALVIISPRSVRAEPIVLEWGAPAGCPSAEAARVLIARALDPEKDTGVSAVRAQIADVGDEFRLDLSIDTDTGVSRTRLFAKRCSTFVEVIALQLGLSSLPLEGASDRGEREPTTRPLGWGARVSAGAGTGPTPQAAPRVAIAAALLRRRLRFELGGSYDAPTRAYYASPADVGARLDVFAAELRGCYGLPVRRVELPLCAGGDLGIMRGVGLGVSDAAREQRLWGALFVVPALRFPREGRISGWLELGAWFSVHRPTFVIRNLGSLYRPDPVTVRAAGGIALQFD